MDERTCSDSPDRVLSAGKPGLHRNLGLPRRRPPNARSGSPGEDRGQPAGVLVYLAPVPQVTLLLRGMRNFDMKRYAPVILVVVLVVTPLAIWAGTSGGSKKSDDPLLVERSVGL